MKISLLSFLITVVCFSQFPAALSEEIKPKVIYGEDNRKDLFEAAPKWIAMADSTVGLFAKKKIKFDGDVAHLKLKPYTDRFKFCKDEPFYEQFTGAYCSGSLVGPDLILTAGHCVMSDMRCRNIKIVFGFGIKVKGEFPFEVPSDEVYSCKNVIKSVADFDGADWSLIRLDRKVEGHTPISVNFNDKIKKGTSLAVIGHPAGLPTKVADDAKVRDASPRGYFRANLDTYMGNSGSAVFNADTMKIEGVLVRGEVDYEDKNGCVQSIRCSENGCSGEDVTKISEVLDTLEDALN